MMMKCLPKDLYEMELDDLYGLFKAFAEVNKKKAEEYEKLEKERRRIETSDKRLDPNDIFEER